MTNKELVQLAFQACNNAYAPYSNFHVGAAVLCSDGTYFLGANIENASYGATVCAERIAIFNAYSYGYRKEEIEKIAIVTHADSIAASCCVCRQVMIELLKKDTPIIFANENEEMILTVEELVPYPFTSEDLE